jgi:transposase
LLASVIIPEVVALPVVPERCGGLDVHQQSVVAGVLLTLAAAKPLRAGRTFSTMPSDWLARDDWLRDLRVEQVARESTGMFWRPVFNLLADGRTITLVNPRTMKAVPGRKTAVKDSEWIADLLRHGLLQPSFIPPQPLRELRELTRYRKTLVQDRADGVHRIQQVLETANIKLGSVASDILVHFHRCTFE